MYVNEGVWSAILLQVVFLQLAMSSEWGYRDERLTPSEWYQEYPQCGGHHQSPIDIVTKDVLVDTSLTKLRLNGYGQSLTGGSLVNNGHSVQVNFPPGKKYIMSGGGFGSNRYRALQLHFHWPRPGSVEGSEHTINGKHYPIEMHIVHIKEPYDDTEQVKNMTDGLAVLAAFLDIGESKNQAVQKILDYAENLTKADSTTAIVDGPSLLNLLPDSETFYRYFGSLTTPPCYETVVWTILAQPVLISRDQLLAFEQIHSFESKHDIGCSDSANCLDTILDENIVGGNFRPTQPYNGRVVTSFVDMEDDIRDIENDMDALCSRMTAAEKTVERISRCAENHANIILKLLRRMFASKEE